MEMRKRNATHSIALYVFPIRSQQIKKFSAQVCTKSNTKTFFFYPNNNSVSLSLSLSLLKVKLKFLLYAINIE
jgi:hypothetical protein